MLQLPWSKKKALPAGITRYYFDEFGIIEEPFQQADWSKKIFKTLFNFIGIADLSILAYTFWKGTYDFSDWLGLISQVAIGVFYLLHLSGRASLHRYYQLSNDYFELKRGVYSHVKVKLVNVKSVEFLKKDIFSNNKLRFRMKNGQTQDVEIIPRMLKVDREKMDNLIEKLNQTVALINQHR